MQRIDTIALNDGTSLVDYHHRLHALLGHGPEAVIDFFRFYQQFGRARDYYLPYLSIFLAHAVLVDDFHDGEDVGVVGEFTETIFAPAYRELKRCFGVAPLISRLPWHEHLQYHLLPEAESDVTFAGVVPLYLYQRVHIRDQQCLVA